MAAHDNRGRLTVNLDGAWRLYSNRLPVAGRALGTVTVGGETGALAYIESTGVYVRVNAGTMLSLPQRKVTKAIDEARTGSGGAGRGQGARAADGVTGTYRVNITIDAAHDEIARQLGGGDRSLGIRLALAQSVTPKSI